MINPVIIKPTSIGKTECVLTTMEVDLLAELKNPPSVKGDGKSSTLDMSTRQQRRWAQRKGYCA